MYENYFGLVERPFSIAPDPQYLFMSPRHKEAMAHLSYGLTQGGGFIVLTGEVGTGKTTLCRNLLDDLPDYVDVALILNPKINELELLQTICDELGIKYVKESSQKELLNLINKHLLDSFADNRHTVLIIDEAQLLSRDVLEQIRLLTNLETTKHKLLQIILIGQPELNDLLSRNDLRQLTQRITARYHLDELKREEMQDYVNHRLSVAGCKKQLFSRQALNKLHALTDGIPRKINVLADHALLAAYSKNVTSIDSKTVDQAAREVFVKAAPKFQPMMKNKWMWVLAVVLLLNALLAWKLLDKEQVASTVETKENSIASAVSKLETPLPTKALVETKGEIKSESKAEQAREIAEETIDVTTKGVVEKAAEVTALSADVSTAVASSDGAAVSTTSIESLAALLETSSDQTARINGFRNLSQVWQKNMPDMLLDSACSEVSKLKLQCLTFSDWQSLLVHNRPAILVLNQNNQLHRVVLTHLQEQTATILIGLQSHSVSVEELQSHWNGNGLVYWQPPEIGAGNYSQGDAGPGVVWLRLYLNQALKQAGLPLLNDTINPEFDSLMSKQVLSLQQHYQLQGDGVLGRQTFMLINEALNPELTPILFKRQ